MFKNCTNCQVQYKAKTANAKYCNDCKILVWAERAKKLQRNRSLRKQEKYNE